jgi:UTP--glucose-1-phosphate uridylyltransferase
MKIRKAVFPVAGFGTRMLPASKAIPKEMLTLVDKPIIQYAVEEAIEAGIEQIIFVTGRTKKSLEDHFDRNIELELALESSGKEDVLNEINKISSMCDFIIVRQKEQKGLGHAVACAKEVVGNEPFAVILPDDVMIGKESVIGQLVKQFEKTGKPTIALKEVDMKETNKYGIVSVKKNLNNRLFLLDNMVEKPKVNPPSNLAIMGRYVLTSDVMNEIFNIESGALGELQLTDAIRNIALKDKVYGYIYEGMRYDCGNKVGYLEATINIALQREDLKKDMINILKRITD